MTAADQTAFDGAFAVYNTTAVARILAGAGLLVVLAVAGDEMSGSARESETYALLLFATTGVLILAGADDLLVLVTGYLLASIPLYGLIGLQRGPVAAEAVLKAYLIGALFGIVLMLGVSVLYGVAGSARYDDLTFSAGRGPTTTVAAGLVAVIAGLMFKGRRSAGAFLDSRRRRRQRNSRHVLDHSAQDRSSDSAVSVRDGAA